MVLAKNLEIVYLGIVFSFFRSPGIIKFFYLVQLGILACFFMCLISNMIISCNGTSMKAILLCGNDLKRILILVFLVLRDAVTFFKILCYGFNFDNAIKL